MMIFQFWARTENEDLEDDGLQVDLIPLFYSTAKRSSD